MASESSIIVPGSQPLTVDRAPAQPVENDSGKEAAELFRRGDERFERFVGVHSSWVWPAPGTSSVMTCT